VCVVVDAVWVRGSLEAAVDIGISQKEKSTRHLFSPRDNVSTSQCFGMGKVIPLVPTITQQL
jgi:hypothetical protein